MLEFLGPCFLPPANYFFNRSGWDSYRGALTSAGVFRFQLGHMHRGFDGESARVIYILQGWREGVRVMYIHTYLCR